MEEADRRIIDELVSDGRISFTDLGRAVGMSTSAVHQRVRRLEQRGIIKGYSARIDHAATGAAMTAFIAVTPLDPAAPDDIADRLRNMSSIEECHSVAGDMNYMLKVRVASPFELEELLAQIRARANVSSKTTVVLSTPWE